MKQVSRFVLKFILGLSTILASCSVVFFLVANPNRSSIMTFSVKVVSSILMDIIISYILPSVGSRDMGRYDTGSCGSFFGFLMGRTMAFFQGVGKYWSFREEL